MDKGELKEDKYYKKARFEDLNSIEIGKYFLYEKDLKDYFGDDENSIILLKRVFQKKYKITRTSSGLPRVPSRPEDKEQIIQLLQTYFNRLRGKIVQKRATSGDSVSLRENIDGIQQIKLLIDHFEDSTETFPYHMFKDYLDNKEYIKSTGDINKQMREFQFNKSQNERIRNLLRQFSMLYLKDKKQDQFDVRDPGVFSDRFKEFMNDRDVSKLPPILRDLLLLLDGKYSVVAENDEIIRDELYNPERVYAELDRLLTDIDKEVEQQKGGGKPIIDKIRGTKGLDEQVTSVVDYILEKYKELHKAHKQVILNKDQEYNMLDEVTTVKILDLEDRLGKAELALSAEQSESSQLREVIQGLSKDILEKNQEIEKKNDEISNVRLQLKGANDNLSRALKNKEYSESEVSRFQSMLDSQIRDLNDKLIKAIQEKTDFEEEKNNLEAKLNELNPKLIDAVSKVAELEAEVARLRDLLQSKDADLSGNRRTIDDLQADIERLSIDLSGNRQQIGKDSDEISGLKQRITEKDATILDLSSNLADTKKRLDEVLADKDALMAAFEEERELLDQKIVRLNQLKRDLENKLKECRQKLAKDLKEEQKNTKDKLNEISEQLEISNDSKLQGLIDRINAVERRLNDLTSSIQELFDEIDTFIASVGDLRGRLAAVTAERDTLLENRTSSTATIARMQSAIDALTESNANLTADLAEARRLKDKCDRDLEDLQRTIRSRTDQDTQTENGEIARLRNELDSVRSQKDRFAQEILDLQRTVSANNRTISELTGQLADAQRLKQECNDKLTAEVGKIAQLTSTIASKEAEIARLRDEYENRISALNAEKADLLAQLERLRAEKTGIERSTARAIEDLSAQIKQLTQQNADKVAEIAALNTTLDDKLAEMSALERTNTNLTLQNIELDRINKDLLADLAKLRSQEQLFKDTQLQIASKNSEIARLNDRIAQLKKDCEERERVLKASHQGELGELRRRNDEEIAKKERDISSLRTELKREEEEKAALTETNRRLEQTNNDMSALIRGYLAEIESLKRKLDALRLNRGEEPNSSPTLPLPTPQVVPTPQQKEQASWNTKYDSLFNSNSFDIRFDKFIGDLKFVVDDPTYNIIKSLLDKYNNSSTNSLFEEPYANNYVKTNFNTDLRELIKNLENMKLIQNGKLVDLKNFASTTSGFKVGGPFSDNKKDQRIKKLKQSVNKLLENLIDNITDSAIKNNYKKKFTEYLTKYNQIANKVADLRGGGDDSLFQYCSKVADNSLKEFLLEEPLPFFSLIQDFERDSKLEVIQPVNEEYVLKLFIVEHLKNYFESKEMKEFYFHAKELLGKDRESIYNYAKMFFVLQEIINTVKSDDRSIDVLRIRSKQYNSSFDYLNFQLESHEYDFYNVAKKELLNTKPINITFKNNHIFLALTEKDDKVYDFNTNLTMTVSNYKYTNDIYYFNDSMVYLFFILSTHFYLQSENMIDSDEYKEVEEKLEKTVRKMKRMKSKDKRSIETLMKERKDFKESK
jgi:DNA repair exonuclease SbcCD ATPase subunit